jgi:hypothetical protein
LLAGPLAWRLHYRDFAPGLPATFEGLLVRLPQ